MELTLIAFLDTLFTDVLGTPVIRCVFAFFEPLCFTLIDASDVADHVRARLTQRILAEQTRLDVDAGEAITLCCEARHLFISQAGANRQTFKGL